jgi:hypothetical protein
MEMNMLKKTMHDGVAMMLNLMRVPSPTSPIDYLLTAYRLPVD